MENTRTATTMRPAPRRAAPPETGTVNANPATRRPTAEEWHHAAATAPDMPLMPDYTPSPSSTPAHQQPRPGPPAPPTPVRHTRPPWTKLTRPGYWALVAVAAYFTYSLTSQIIGNSTFWYGSGHWTFIALYLPVAAWRSHTMGYPWWACFAAILPIANIFMFFWLGLVEHATKRPPWGRLVLAAIAAFAFIAVLIMITREFVPANQPAPEVQPQNPSTTPQTAAVQPTGSTYCDGLLTNTARLSATAMYRPDTYQESMEIAAARNNGLTTGLGPDDPIYKELALTPRETFATKENANAVIAWIQSLKPSECPPNVWNPWVTNLHHDGSGSFTILFDIVGIRRGFPVTHTNHMMFKPGTPEEGITPIPADVSTPETPATNPTERPMWDTITLRTVTGLLIDGFQEPPDSIAVIRTHDGIQNCRMDVQDETWQKVSIGDTLTVQGIPIDVTGEQTPLLDLCTVTAWQAEP